MTTNQIAYWNLQESKRSNQAKEGLQAQEISEKMRSNRAVENETRRHNVASENLTGQQIAASRDAAATKGFTDVVGSVIKSAGSIISTLLR